MRNRNSSLTDTDDQPGQESFLDVITNIVGILIILVVVVGVQAKDAWIEAADRAPVEEPEEKIDVEGPQAAAASVEHDIQELMQKTEIVKLAMAAHAQRRGELQLLIEAARRSLEQRRGQLDQATRQDFDLQRDLNAASQELEELQRQQLALEQSPEQVEVLDHLPTPMAKTVFGKEEHFRLEHGRLTYVPLNELIDRLKGEWEDKIWRLENAPQVTETIGPVDGFRMKYTLARKTIKVQTPSGPLVREMAGLTRFILVPESDNLGEPIRDALAPNSQFRRRLQSFDPKTTTITVWCYPDTFDSFRQLKADLYGLGFLTAGRPLPSGHPIGGSPDGSRSVAQ